MKSIELNDDLQMPRLLPCWLLPLRCDAVVQVSLVALLLRGDGFDHYRCRCSFVARMHCAFAFAFFCSSSAWTFKNKTSNQ